MILNYSLIIGRELNSHDFSDSQLLSVRLCSLSQAADVQNQLNREHLQYV